MRRTPHEFGNVPYEDLSRLAVVGKTVIELVESSLVFHFDFREFSADLQGRVDAGHASWIDGRDITDLERSNVHASSVISRLTAVLTLPPADPFKARPSKQPPLVVPGVRNEWAEQTSMVLQEVGVYGPDGHSSAAHTAVAPALFQIALGIHQTSERQHRELEAKALLPQDRVFVGHFDRMSEVAEAFKAGLPTVSTKPLYVEEIIETAQSFDSGTTAPVDIAGSTYALSDIVPPSDIVQGLEPRDETYGRYHDLRIDNAAAYLGDLLSDIERLNRQLAVK